MSKEELIKKFEKLPDHLREELLDYINYLENKAVKEKHETALISESSLKKDWLKPEEDEAWKDL